MAYFGGHASLGDVAHYWEFDESSGSRTSDVSAFVFSDFNTVTRETGNGPKAYAARFTRANSEILYLDSTTFHTSYSISCWVYPITDPGASFVGIHGFGAGFPTGIQFAVYRQNLSPGSLVTLVSDQVGGYKFTYNAGASYNLIFNQWNWICHTFDDSDKKIRSRINGTATQTSTALATSHYNTAQQWDVGYTHLGASTSPFFDGRIAEYGYWGRAITESEMDSLWNSGNGLFLRSPETATKTGSTAATSVIGGDWLAGRVFAGNTAAQSVVSGRSLISMYKTGSTAGQSTVNGPRVGSSLKTGSVPCTSTLNGPRVIESYKTGAVAATATVNAIRIASMNIFGDLACQSEVKGAYANWVNPSYVTRTTNRLPQFETNFNRRAVYPRGYIRGWRQRP